LFKINLIKKKYLNKKNYNKFIINNQKGVEIAKNIVLCGVKKLTIHDS